MKKGAINIGYKPRKLGFNNQTTLVPSAERYSTISYNDITAYAAKAAAVPESSIAMAMEALYDALSYFVLNGHSVQIPNIGTFSLSVRCKAADDLESFTENFRSNLRQIRRKGTTILPDIQINPLFMLSCKVCVDLPRKNPGAPIRGSRNPLKGQPLTVFACR